MPRWTISTRAAGAVLAGCAISFTVMLTGAIIAKILYGSTRTEDNPVQAAAFAVGAVAGVVYCRSRLR